MQELLWHNLLWQIDRSDDNWGWHKWKWYFLPKNYLNPADDFLGVYLPKLLSLSLRESGVDADNEDLDGRVIAIDLVERSRT